MKETRWLLSARNPRLTSVLSSQLQTARCFPIRPFVCSVLSVGWFVGSFFCLGSAARMQCVIGCRCYHGSSLLDCCFSLGKVLAYIPV